MLAIPRLSRRIGSPVAVTSRSELTLPNGSEAAIASKAAVETAMRVCKVLGREFDFLGYTFGRMYSARIGRRVSATGLKEEHSARGRENPRADRAIVHMAGDHNGGRRREPHAARMGELLLPSQGTQLDLLAGLVYTTFALMKNLKSFNITKILR